MADKKTYLLNDVKHINKTHYRWHDEKLPRHRDWDSAEVKDSWSSEQCFMCRYYIKLSGRMGADWGACSNPESPMNSSMMFEHDGCDFCDPVDNEFL